MIFVNKYRITFCSKRQNYVETSNFRSNSTAMKQAMELLRSLWYKLRMFVIPIEGPENFYCDNKALYKNFAVIYSVIRKKMQRISYHFC